MPKSQRAQQPLYLLSVRYMLPEHAPTIGNDGGLMQLHSPTQAIAIRKLGPSEFPEGGTASRPNTINIITGHSEQQ